ADIFADHCSLRNVIIHQLHCFFLKHTPPTEIYTLSLHDALPISPVAADGSSPDGLNARRQNYRWSRQFWVIQNERLKHLDGAAAWANQVLRNIGRLYIAIISRFRLAVVFLCNIFLENSSSLALSSFVFIPIDHV